MANVIVAHYAIRSNHLIRAIRHASGQHERNAEIMAVLAASQDAKFITSVFRSNCGANTRLIVLCVVWIWHINGLRFCERLRQQRARLTMPKTLR